MFNILTSKYLCNKVVMFDARTEELTEDAQNIKIVTTSRNVQIDYNYVAKYG